jgi:hypothetical protein
MASLFLSRKGKLPPIGSLSPPLSMALFTTVNLHTRKRRMPTIHEHMKASMILPEYAN